MSDGSILFAYDGSDYAKTAIEQAAEQLESGRRAIVLTVWEPYVPAFVGVAVIPAEVEEGVEEDARRVAEEGATIAREAGFDAEPAAERGDSVWQRIVDVADERDVGIVVMGSHGRTGIPRAFIGSVAGAVASHSNRPVLIVNVAAERTGKSG